MKQPKHELRDPVVRHVLEGRAPKEFAATYNVSPIWICRTLWNAGLKRQYVTQNEWREIRRQRSLKKQRLLSET